MNVVMLEYVSLDFKTPYDELVELREFLTAQEISEVTGLTRETISRARPDQRFQRRTEVALRDLYRVVGKLRAVREVENGQLAALLRREQAQFAGRSIAQLLRDGQVDVVLRAIAAETPAGGGEAGGFRLGPEVEGQLEPWVEPSGDEVVLDPDLDRRIDALLDTDPVLRSRLVGIEAALVEHFGPEAEVERQIVEDYDSEEPSEELYLRVRADLAFGDAVDRLTDFLRREEKLLDPVHRHVAIGFL